MRLCAITDRRLYPGDERDRCTALVRQAVRWAAAGVDSIQLREKDLSAAALEELAGRLVEAIRAAQTGRPARILINSPHAAAICRAAGADGIHLPALAPSAMQERVRAACEAGRPVSVACHAAEEAAAVSEAGAALILFAPVFEKPLGGGEALPLPGVGLTALREACRAAGPTPVYALGGVTVANAAECLAAGAAGVAGIRLFLGEDWTVLVNPAFHHAL